MTNERYTLEALLEQDAGSEAGEGYYATLEVREDLQGLWVRWQDYERLRTALERITRLPRYWGDNNTARPVQWWEIAEVALASLSSAPPVEPTPNATPGAALLAEDSHGQVASLQGSGGCSEQPQSPSDTLAQFLNNALPKGSPLWAEYRALVGGAATAPQSMFIPDPTCTCAACLRARLAAKSGAEPECQVQRGPACGYYPDCPCGRSALRTTEQ